MTSPQTRRTAIATAGAGIAGLIGSSFLFPQSAMAAMSSAAGIVAGGSLDGPDQPIHFSAFGTRIALDDAADPTFLGALSWNDPTGLDGQPVIFNLASVISYGTTAIENERLLVGTVSTNGTGAHPFALLLTDQGDVGTAIDHARLVVGAASQDLIGTPVAASDVSYDVEGDLTAGNIQIVTLF